MSYNGPEGRFWTEIHHEKPDGRCAHSCAGGKAAQPGLRTASAPTPCPTLLSRHLRSCAVPRQIHTLRALLSMPLHIFVLLVPPRQI